MSRTEAGLCAKCRHAQIIVNDRGSTFYLCALALADERYAKYPRLPVVSCNGHETGEPASASVRGKLK